jgi:flagellar hook-associated protein 1 FlgK
MGLTSALGVGRSALAAYQAALQIVGNNIANAATPGYTRLSADLSAIPGLTDRAGQIGAGVGLTSIRRNASDALEARLRTATSDKGSATVERESLTRVEDVFNALGDNNLGSLVSQFFKSWGDLQNDPQNIATRGIVINSGQALTQRFQKIRGDLTDARNSLNAEIVTATQQGDEIASKIADLNVQITTAESASTGPASALRDQRNQLLSKLSDLFSVTVREQPSGAVNVYVGNESLVQGGQSSGLKAVSELDANGRAITVVRLKQGGGQIKPTSGQVEGLITSRDAHIAEQQDRLDALAGAIINEVNKIHSGGQGLQGYSSIQGTSAVIDPTVSLASTANGLAFPPKTGSFFIDVKDSASGVSTRHQVNIDLDGIGADSTLNTVAADISANVPGVTAAVLANGQLKLTAAAGTTMSFADDTSGFLAAMGVNTFFSGTTSADIAVDSTIASNPALVAAAKSDLPGDGSNATSLISLQNQVVASLGGVSLSDYYATTTAGIAVKSSSAQSALDASGIIFDALTSQRESISGVNLDEEAVSMISLQRGFEGAARYTTVVNQMLQTLLELVR